MVLRSISQVFRNGTYLYFDELSCYGHEERAFREFVEQTGLRFVLRGETENLLHVFFQCVDDKDANEGQPLCTPRSIPRGSRESTGSVS